LHELIDGSLDSCGLVLDGSLEAYSGLFTLLFDELDLGFKLRIDGSLEVGGTLSLGSFSLFSDDLGLLIHSLFDGVDCSITAISNIVSSGIH